jgi:serine/threonine-protein kinase RsbW
MTARKARVFEARMQALPETAAYVESFCNRHGISRSDTLRLTLIVEELFSNTIEHGYRGESNSPIHITLSAGMDAIALLYEDAAPRYDPLSRLSGPAFDPAASVDSRPIGKVGIHLIRQLTEGARYAHEGGRNRLWLRLRRGS